MTLEEYIPNWLTNFVETLNDDIIANEEFAAVIGDCAAIGRRPQIGYRFTE